ncbi:MAG: DUF2809 domain-containing protein [Salinimicrobium sp.]
MFFDHSRTNSPLNRIYTWWGQRAKEFISSLSKPAIYAALQKSYFLASLILFLLLVFIAAYVLNDIIRPYGGDVLVVIFLYCLLKSFFRIPVKNAIFGVLVFAFALEGLQALRLVQRLGLEGNKLASAVFGSHFDWKDLLLYLLGGGIVLVLEKTKNKIFGSEKAEV